MNMLLSNFLILLNLFYFTKSFLKKASIGHTSFAFFIILSTILLSLINYPSFKLIGTTIMNLIYILFIFILFKGNVYKKLFVFLLFVLTISLSELLITNLMYFSFNLTEHMLDTYIYTIAILFSNLLTFLVLYLLVNFFTLDILSKHTKFMWLSLILPLTTLLFLYNLSNYFDTFKDNITILLVILGLIVSNIISLIAILKDFKRIELSKEIENTRIKYEMLNKQYDVNFYFLHDTIRELTKLTTLMNENNFLDFQKNVIYLHRNLSKSFNSINSNSKILNSLINFRISDITNFNIDVKQLIEYNDFSFISLEDYQYIFSELLNMGIDQCINSKSINPKIIFKTMKVKQQVIIQITFSINDSITLDFSELGRYAARCNANISEKTYTSNSNTYQDIIIVFFTLFS